MLGYVLLAGSLLLGLVAGKDLLTIGGYFVDGLTAWSTLQLLGVVALIEMLSVFLDMTGSLQRIVSGLGQIFKDSRVLVALIPSLLGLLPVPGGAMLSAPMVGSYGDELGADADRKGTINLFFRHVWDVVVPFKPNLILVSTMLNIPLFTIIAWQIPATLVGAAAGYWYLVGRLPQPEPAARPAAAGNGSGMPLLVEAAPLVVPLVLALALSIDFLYAMGIGMAIGLATHRLPVHGLRKVVSKGLRPRLLFTLAAVMIFKTVLDNSGLMREMAEALTAVGVPVLLLALLLPPAVALATGLDLPAVALVFPFIIEVLPDPLLLMPYVSLMLLVNAVAQTYSPVHICMVVGNEYYGTSLRRVAAMSLFPQGLRVAVGLVLAWLAATYMLG